MSRSLAPTEERGGEAQVLHELAAALARGLEHGEHGEGVAAGDERGHAAWREAGGGGAREPCEAGCRDGEARRELSGARGLDCGRRPARRRRRGAH